MNSFEYDRELRLPERLVRQFLPVTPQLRRAHIGCFPGLGQDQAKNDEIFYPHLTEILNGNLDPILRFDALMGREKKAEKAFALRTGKALFMRVERPEKGSAIEDFAKAKSEDTTLPLEARQLALLMMRLMNAEAARGKTKEKAQPSAERGLQGSAANPDLVTDPVPQATQGEVDDWSRGIAVVKELLQNARSPDPELAHAIIVQAEALLACAEAFRTTSIERNRLAERFVALRSRLDDCLTPQERMTVAWPLVLPVDFDLADLEHLMSETERTTRGLAEAERASLALKEAVARANDAEDMAEVERLTPQRVAAIAEHQTAKAGRGFSVSEMGRWLAEHSGALVVEEPEPSMETEPEGEMLDSIVEVAHEEVLSEATPTTIAEELAPEPPAAIVPAEEGTALSAETSVEGILETVAIADTAESFKEISPAMDEFPDIVAAADIAAYAPTVTEDPHAEDAEAMLVPAEGWGGGKTMAELIAGYLRRSETAFAADLAELAEARGTDVPIPSTFLRA